MPYEKNRDVSVLSSRYGFRLLAGMGELRVSPLRTFCLLCHMLETCPKLRVAIGCRNGTHTTPGCCPELQLLKLQKDYMDAGGPHSSHFFASTQNYSGKAERWDHEKQDQVPARK